MKVAKTKWKQNIMSDCIKTVKVKDAVQKKDRAMLLILPSRLIC